MSARLVSRKPRRYASFVAVSISRVRLSGCAVRIFSDSELVIYLTQSVNPMRPCCQPPATRQFWALVDGGPIHKRFVGLPEMTGAEYGSIELHSHPLLRIIGKDLFSPGVLTMAEINEVVVRGTAAGFAQEILAGRHPLTADGPVAAGGADTGPTPYDVLLAALGA